MGLSSDNFLFVEGVLRVVFWNFSSSCLPRVLSFRLGAGYIGGLLVPQSGFGLVLADGLG